MAAWYESRVDRLIREAQERGTFDDLPGSGQPLPGIDGEYDEDWWLKQLVRREGVTGAVPATLALRKAVEDLDDVVATLKSEAAVRRLVADLNERIERARRSQLDGPPVYLPQLDAEDVVRRWRAA